jgi:hypothetical protein
MPCAMLHTVMRPFSHALALPGGSRGRRFESARPDEQKAWSHVLFRSWEPSEICLLC